MKCWWKSKTLWFNGIMAGLTAAEASFSLLQPVLPMNVYSVLAFTLAVANAVLRILTTQGIGK